MILSGFLENENKQAKKTKDSSDNDVIDINSSKRMFGKIKGI